MCYGFMSIMKWKNKNLQNQQITDHHRNTFTYPSNFNDICLCDTIFALQSRGTLQSSNGFTHVSFRSLKHGINSLPQK